VASIYKTSDGSWRVQIRKRGVALTRNFSRKVDATAWATLREAEIERGDAGLPRRTSGTLGELLASYHQIIYPLKRYSRSKVYELSRLDRDLGALPVSALTTERIVRYALELRQHTGGGGVRTRLGYLHEVLRAAVDLWDAPTATLVQVKQAMAALRRQQVTARATPRTRRPTDTELSAIIAFHEGNKLAGVDLPAILNVLRVLPLRIGELLKIEWQDLLPDQRAVKLRERKHPDVTVRVTNDYVIPLPVIDGVDTWAAIAHRPSWLPRPFPFARQSVTNTFLRAARAVGVTDLHVHDLRAFAISKLLEAGVPIAIVAHVSGHRNWKIMQSVYARLDPVQVARAIEQARAQPQIQL
jgi:integrase